MASSDPPAGCCAPSDTFDGGSEVFGAALYAIGDREQIPDTAALASLGCGNPTVVAELHEGETVLDLGSGGSIDVRGHIEEIPLPAESVDVIISNCVIKPLERQAQGHRRGGACASPRRAIRRVGRRRRRGHG